MPVRRLFWKLLLIGEGLEGKRSGGRGSGGSGNGSNGSSAGSSGSDGGNGGAWSWSLSLSAEEEARRFERTLHHRSVSSSGHVEVLCPRRNLLLVVVCVHVCCAFCFHVDSTSHPRPVLAMVSIYDGLCLFYF